MAKETPRRPSAEVQGEGELKKLEEEEEEEEEENLDDNAPRTRLPTAGPWLLLEPQHWAIHSAAQLLLGILRDLREEEDWKKFKGELLRFPVKEGVVKIPKTLLKRANIWQLRDLLLSYYEEAYAVEVTALVLQAMDYKPRVGNVFLLTRLIRITHLRLLATLKTLRESDLKKFKDELSMFPFKEGYVSIPKGLLEEANIWELSELLLTYYDEDYALEVTEETIGCKPLSEWYLRFTGKSAERPPEMYVSRHQSAGFLSSKIIQALEELIPIKRATKGSLERFTISGNEMICKGRKELIDILEEDLELFLKVLHSYRVITLKECKDIFKMEKDSKEKSKKLLSLIQERREQACCRFLACVEMVYPGSIQILLLAVQGLGQTPLQMSGSSVLQQEGRRMKLENPTGPGDSVLCGWCPSEHLPEKITPETVWDSQRSHYLYRLCFTEAGSFLCSYTDLIFEVSGAVTITYHFDSWSKHHLWDEGKLIVAGPLLNVQVDPEEAVGAIHYPHFVCLAGEDSSHIHVAHFVEGEMRLKKPDTVRPYHAVLKTVSFCSCGVIFKKPWFKQKILVHAVALLYQELDISVPKFHLYLIPNDSSLRKNVHDFEEMWPSWRLQKPSGTLKPLRIGSRFFIQNLDGVTVCPKELEFQYKEERFLKICAEHMQDNFSFKMIEKNKNELIWEAHVRQEELKSSVLHSGPVLQSEFPLFAEEGRSTKGKNLDLPQKMKPEVVWDSERGHEVYRMCPTEAGSFQCGETDLIWDLREAVPLMYDFDSWPKHLEEQTTEECHIAGPLLNIQVTAIEAVAAIHIPHSLCLEGEDSSHVYIAHFVEGQMRLEKPDRVEPQHAVWENPKFSSLGVIFKKWFKQRFNTVVLLYHSLQLETPTFHLYLLPNDASLIKAVTKREAKYNSRRLEKPPVTLQPLAIGSQFSVKTSDDVTVCPEELEFQYLDAERLQQYVELSAEEMQERFTFYLLKKGTSEIVWKAHLKRKELSSEEMASLLLYPAQGGSGYTLTNASFSRNNSGYGVEGRVMEKTITDYLLAALENLREDELKKFKLKLHEFSVEEGFDKIPRGKLEKADVVDLSQLLLSFYMEDYAVQVTTDVLRSINCKDEAERLLTLCRKGVPTQRSQRR